MNEEIEQTSPKTPKIKTEGIKSEEEKEKVTTNKPITGTNAASPEIPHKNRKDKNLEHQAEMKKIILKISQKIYQKMQRII